jgi:membrane protease YdiL (CAAX protease family)
MDPTGMESKKEIQRHIITFVTITTAITAGIFVWMLNGAKVETGSVFLMMWTPGIAALLTSAIHKDKLGEFGWKPGRAHFLVYGYLFPLIVSGIGYGLVWLSGYAEFSTAEVTNYRWANMLGFDLPAPFLAGALSKMSLGFLFTVVFVLGEEIGWSGFLTPKLLKLTSVPYTSLLVGGFWAVWHFPAFVGGLYGSGTPLWVALPGFTLVSVAESLVRTVLITKSGSLWVGVVLHASANIILMGMFWDMTVHKGYAGYLVSESGVLLGIVYMTMAVLFWKWQAHTPDRSVRSRET